LEIAVPKVSAGKMKNVGKTGAGQSQDAATASAITN
jgi:hypothetical protein